MYLKSTLESFIFFLISIKMGIQETHQSHKYECISASLLIPCYERNGNNVITVKTEEPAVLPCIVKNVDTSKTVISWWKENEMTEISLGKRILNPRYKLSKATENDWSLVIKQTRITDAGHYICQINLSTLMEMRVTLVVLKSGRHADVRMDSITEDESSLSQLKTKYVSLTGVSKAHLYSSITFNCEVRYLYDNINAGIRWSHSNIFLDYNGKWKDYISIRWMGNLTLTSELLLDPVLPEHSGKWTCHKIPTSKSDAEEFSSIDLQIIDKHSKNVQNNSLKLSIKSSSTYPTVCQVSMIIFLLLFHFHFYLFSGLFKCVYML